jgi:hypothetical protein
MVYDKGLGFRVQGLEFRIKGFGFRFQRLPFLLRVEGSNPRSDNRQKSAIIYLILRIESDDPITCILGTIDCEGEF